MDTNDYKECRLTTNDNPYNPFTQFNEWFLYDVEQGYNTCGYLARIAQFTDDMTDRERDIEKDRAMNKILKNDFLNIYKKVQRPTSSAS